MHFTQELKLSSDGTMGITVDEFASLNLVCSADPNTFREHVVVDYRGLSGADCEKKSKSLKAMAHKRGWLYRPLNDA